MEIIEGREYNFKLYDINKDEALEKILNSDLSKEEQIQQIQEIIYNTMELYNKEVEKGNGIDFVLLNALERRRKAIKKLGNEAEFIRKGKYIIGLDLKQIEENKREI